MEIDTLALSVDGDEKVGVDRVGRLLQDLGPTTSA